MLIIVQHPIMDMRKLYKDDGMYAEYAMPTWPIPGKGEKLKYIGAVMNCIVQLKMQLNLLV